MEPNNPNNQYNQQQYNPYNQPPPFGMPLASIPNATAILILGICSIVFCGLGPILGTIAIILSKQARIEFESKPNAYDPGSMSNVRTGRICGIIGLIVGSLFWVFWICYMLFFVWVFGEAVSQIRMN
jgi:hypothetical protein